MSWSPGHLGRWSAHFLTWPSFQVGCFSGLRLPGLAPLVPRQFFLAMALMSVAPTAVLLHIVQ
eukprot:12383111-Heterocapsa_arctica.AAC.1